MRKLSAVCRSRETELQVTESDPRVSSGAVVTKRSLVSENTQSMGACEGVLKALGWAKPSSLETAVTAANMGSLNG